MSGERRVRPRRGWRLLLLLPLASVPFLARGAPAAGEEPWRISGSRLSGTVDGPTQIDSLQVHHGTLWIRALRGTWLPALQAVELEGPIQIRDSTRTLEARRGRYFRDTERLELEEDVRGEGPEGRFYADRLIDDRARQELTLSGFVRLREAERELRCQWLRYLLADSFATAGDDIFLEDSADSVTVEGGRLEYDRGARRMIVLGTETRRPRLQRSIGASATALVVEADTLRLQSDARSGEARGHVALTYGEASGSCARLQLFEARDEALLLGAPEVHDREGRIRGDTISIEMRGGRADRLLVRPRAVTEYAPEGNPGETHFAVGDTLTAFLSGGAIRTVLLQGAAEALYLPSRPDRRDGVGLNWTAGRRLRLAFGDEGVDRVQFEGAVHGRYLLPRAEGADTLFGGPTERVLGYPPTVLDELRRLAEGGRCEPPDSLVARLPFDPAQTVAYSGDGLEFTMADQRITITGQGAVTYQGSELKADSIAFHAPEDLIVAAGKPVLRDRGSEVEGTRMTYRVDTRQGLVFQGRSEMGTGRYFGERVKQVGTKTLYVRNGEFTTCDADTPHFHFLAPEMKVIPQEKVIARPVVLFLGRVPLFVIPYAVFPTRSGRRSGILVPNFELGFDTARGRFVNNVGYYYAPNDYVDALLWLDYYEESPRIIYNARTRYKLRYVLGGTVDASFSRQEDDAGSTQRRWLFNLDHDQVLGDRFSLKASCRFQSDKDYGADRDIGANVDERITQSLRSTVGLNKSWSAASLSLTGDRTENLPSDVYPGGSVAQTLPSFNLTLNSFPLGVKPDARGQGGRWPLLASTYARGDLRVLSTYARSTLDCDSAGCTREIRSNHGAGLNVSLSDKRRLFGAVNLTPSTTVAAAWANHGEEGESNPYGATWGLGLATGSTVYGTFFPRIGALEGLRHVIDLSASYLYRPPNSRASDFPSVGGISLSGSRASTLSLSVSQRFHLKWRHGEKTRKQENLLTWTTSTGYNFLAKENVQPWSRINHSWRLQPGGALSSDVSLAHDAEHGRRDYSLSLRTTLRWRGGGETRAPAGGPAEDEAIYEGQGGFGDPLGGSGTGPERSSPSAAATGPWQLTLTHTFSRSRNDDAVSERSTLNAALGMSVTAAWRLQYSVYFDLTEGSVTSQGYSLGRDLHCWQASLERRSSGGRSSFYFRIAVKDLPDIKYERRSS
jgi:lipopolysaccharide export system protein LptA